MTDERRPIPDLKEVMERARRLDPEAVAEVFGEAEPDAAVLEFVPRDDGPSMALSAFLSDVRRDLDARAEQRSLGSIPPPPQMRPRKRWSLLGAAAVLVLVGGGAAWSIGQTSGGAAANQAVEAPYKASEAMPLPLAEPNSRDAEPAMQVTEAPEPSEALPSPQPPVEATEAVQARPTAAPEQPTRKTKAQPTASELADLEKQAYAAWSAGELDKAERLLRELVKKTRSRKQREQFFGDLLSLVEQRGNQAKTVALWRSYLRRYPKGRYADDLQARLCRSEGTAACWDKYLKKHPKGAHRLEAESASRN